MVKWIAPSFEAKEEIDSNFENFYTPIDSPLKPLSNVIKEWTRVEAIIMHFWTLLHDHG